MKSSPTELITYDQGGGVRSLRVPIPNNPLGYTLVYVVDTDSGPVLIDTGWDDPLSWDTLTEGLSACGTTVGEIHGVVITHHHPDHHGLSGQVREASGAWVAMHAADASIVRRTRETRPERCSRTWRPSSRRPAPRRSTSHRSAGPP